MSDLGRAAVARALGVPASTLDTAPHAGGMALGSVVTRWTCTSGSAVCKTPLPGRREGFDREVAFYRSRAGALGDRVPRALRVEDDALVLEDLSRAEPGHRLDGLDRDELHQLLATVRALGDADSSGLPERRVHGEAAVSRFHGRWRALRALRPVSDEVERAVEGLGDPSAELAALTGAHLVHGDVHAENVLLDGARVVVLDWASAARGAQAWDIAGALGCARPDVLLGGVDAMDEPGVRVAARWLFMGTSVWLSRDDPARNESIVARQWDRTCALLLAARR